VRVRAHARVCVYLGNDRKFAPPSVTATHGIVTGYNPQIKNVGYTTHTVSLFCFTLI